MNEGSVRLAIDAPKSVTILRSELLQAADANRDAAELSPALARLLEREANRPIRGKRSARMVKPARTVNPFENLTGDLAGNPAGNLTGDLTGNPAENFAGNSSETQTGDFTPEASK